MDVLGGGVGDSADEPVPIGGRTVRWSRGCTCERDEERCVWGRGR
jgi:hypothetical protein